MPLSSTIDRRPVASTDSWPEGIVARFLTVGGATVDITEHRSDIHTVTTLEARDAGKPERAIDVRYTSGCRGCQIEMVHDYDVDAAEADGFFAHLARTYRSPQEWAQGHAEKCRALPRP
jgi:hypothetical protein